jgi:hypothetical protein
LAENASYSSRYAVATQTLLRMMERMQTAGISVTATPQQQWKAQDDNTDDHNDDNIDHDNHDDGGDGGDADMEGVGEGGVDADANGDADDAGDGVGGAHGHHHDDAADAAAVAADTEAGDL